jgi:hypothetical protein
MEKILHYYGFGRKGFAIEIDEAFFPTHTAEVDELETVPLYPILSISGRNLALMGIEGISRIQLETDTSEAHRKEHPERTTSFLDSLT